MGLYNEEQPERRRIQVRGVVQGVGFRPFVYNLAQSFALAGFVLNDDNGVVIEVEGQTLRIDAFLHTLVSAPPSLARIDEVDQAVIPIRADTGFTIAPSPPAADRRLPITPDSATCDDCLRELFDPTDRRFRYPFINCTNCGPRFTIIEDVPYDRERTTMRHFAQCPDCLAEYRDPGDRRFHAQANACPICGPRLKFNQPPNPAHYRRRSAAGRRGTVAAGGNPGDQGSGRLPSGMPGRQPTGSCTATPAQAT
jgi:hydrogenase maturation protein HypF